MIAFRRCDSPVTAMTQSFKLKLEKLVEVGVYDSYKIANEYALVILSMRLPYWMFRKEEQYYLCVEDAQVDTVMVQLEKYNNENHTVKPQVTVENEEKTEHETFRGQKLEL